jgi:flavin-dependent dehydrogenase
MCDGNPEDHFSIVLNRITERWGIRGVGRPRIKLLPLAPINRTFANRLLVVGDAAGLVKPTTGGGIYYSLKSAFIGAEVLAEALHRNTLTAAFLSQYEAQWKSNLGGEFEAQLVLRRLAEKLSDVQIEDLFHLAQTDGIIPLIRAKAQFNKHRDFILALLRHSSARQILFKTVLR